MSLQMEERQKRLDEQVGRQEAAARWRADWYASVAVMAGAVPVPTQKAEPAETMLQMLARWNRQAEARRQADEEDKARFNAEFSQWWAEQQAAKPTP